LVKGKFNDVIDDLVNYFDFLSFEAVLQDVRDHVISVLTRSQIVGSCNNLLNNWPINLGARKFFEHALNNTTSTLVFAQFKHLSLNDWDKELDFLKRHVYDDTLNDIVRFFAVHHLDDHFFVELGYDFFFLLN